MAKLAYLFVYFARCKWYHFGPVKSCIFIHMGFLQRFRKKKQSPADAVVHRKAPPHPRPQSAPTTAVANNIKYIIAIASGKGGVGKSTVTHQLAHALKMQGHSVGILDADVYGPSQASMFDTKKLAKVEQNWLMPVEHQGLKFISMNTVSHQQGAMVVRSPIANRAISQFLTAVNWGTLDYLLIDLPPGTGDIQLSVAQKAKLTGAIIVTTPQPLAAEIAAKSLSMFEKVNVPVIGIIENMSGYQCQHCHQHNDIFTAGGGQRLADEGHVPLLCQIPLSQHLVENNKKAPENIDEGFVSAAKQVQLWLDKQAGLDNDEPKQAFISDDKLQLHLIWSESHNQSISAFDLRTMCACAACQDEFTGEPILNVSQIPKDIKIIDAKPVGRYGLGVRFSDGHSTGIYRYKKLKSSN